MWPVFQDSVEIQTHRIQTSNILPRVVNKSWGRRAAVAADVLSDKGAVQAFSLGHRPRNSRHQEPLALKARFTRDVIRSIIGTTLICVSGILGLRTITELTPPKAFGVGSLGNRTPRGDAPGWRKTAPLALNRDCSATSLLARVWHAARLPLQ
jgi:hypothetical protein